MSSESPESRGQHEILKQELLSGSITPEDFRKRLIDLDQSTPGRELSYGNLELLKDTQIQEWVSQHLEYKADLDNLLSFTEFHVGQIKACKNSNNAGALEHFRNALNLVEDSPWATYIEATIAYFESNVPKLSHLMKTIPEGKNKAVLERLVSGLQERGFPDYKQDY